MNQQLLTLLSPADPPASYMARTGEWIGVTGLCVFTFFSLLGIAGANLGLALMFLALLLTPQAWLRLLHHPLFWLCVLSIVYILLRGALASSEIAKSGGTLNNQANDWAMLFLFFIPGWWISRSPNRIHLALWLMFAGFTLGIISSLNGLAIERMLNGMRSGLHFGKPIIFGFDCAAAVIALMTLTLYWIDQRDGQRTLRIVKLSLTSLAILFFIQGLIVSQSRGVWLALLSALPATWLVLRLRKTPAHPFRIWQRLAIAAGTVAVLLSVLLLNWNTINQRFMYERHELSVVLSEGLDEAPLNSSTYRLHLWRFGLHKWLERPLLGWGPGMTQRLVDSEHEAGLKHPDGKGFDHLHNTYLEVLLQLGLVGATLIALICGLTIYLLISRYRARHISTYMLALLAGNFVLIVVYSLTDFRHLHWNWRFYWLILAGIAFAYTLRPHRASTDSG